VIADSGKQIRKHGGKPGNFPHEIFKNIFTCSTQQIPMILPPLPKIVQEQLTLVLPPPQYYQLVAALAVSHVFFILCEKKDE